MGDVDIRHFERHRGQIVDHRAVHQLGVLVVDAVLVEPAADALDGAAADLLVGQQRVDHPAAILHHPVVQQPHHAGLDIDLDMRGMRAVGEDVDPVAQPEMPRLGELGLDVVGQLAELEMADPADLGERDPGRVAAGIDHLAARHVEPVGRGLQERAGEPEDLLAQRAPGEPGRLAADRRRPAGIGAAAIGHRVGVAGDHADPLDRDADGGRRDLAHDGVRPLPLLGDADGAQHAAARLQAHRAGVLRGDGRLAGAVIAFRPGRRPLDERTHADAAPDPVFAQRLLLGAELPVADPLDQLFEAGLVRQILDMHPRGGAAGV